MPPKKKSTGATAATVGVTPTKSPSGSPAKTTISIPPPTAGAPTPRSPSYSNTPSKKDRRSISREGNGQGCFTPSSKAAVSSPSSPEVPLRTPEHQHSHHRNHKLGSSTTASPSAPPAPASSPVPMTDKTPHRTTQPLTPPGSEAKRVSLTVLSTSPVPPPPPPTSPVPVPKKATLEVQTPHRCSQRSAESAAPSPARAKENVKRTSSTGPAAAPLVRSPSQKRRAEGSAAAATPAPNNEKAASTASNTKNSGNGASIQAEPTTATSCSGAKRHRQRSRTASPPSSALSQSVEHLICESKVIAPDVSGIRCIAVHPSEQEVVVARENGSLVRYDVSFFQNIPQFVQQRHTGGQTRRTITSLAYVTVPAAVSSSTTTASTSSSDASSTRHVLLASMMSGQIVVYDAELLVPLALHQRSGGAIWQLTAAGPGCIYAAMADGSWQQLRLVCKRKGAAPQLELVRVVPGISGADRALTVATSPSLRMAVGSDDAGNVHAWRLPSGATAGAAPSEDDELATAAGRARGLAEHESLWTTKLAKGIALSCAVVGGTSRPCVVVGTSMGDIVLLDAAHGHVFQTFSQHKGPVTTLVVQEDAVVFASGWHESLRSYRCSVDGDWHPAEVKRRTHYHEASHLALLPNRRLILSASRDGTILYSPVARLFSAPAMYVVVTTQQFAYAAHRSVLLQSRFDTVEAFRMDGAGRHWVPFFGHRLEGRFHLCGLWCDSQLDYILFSTEERLGLLRVVWRAQAAMTIVRIEEVLELPAGTGVVDVCWSAPAVAAASSVESDEEGAAAAVAASSDTGAQRVLYVLYDDAVTSVTLTEGYPIVHTSVLVRGRALPGDSIRPYRVMCRPTAAAGARELTIYGHRGSCRMQLMADGTPDAASLVSDLDDIYELVHEVPVLAKRPTGTQQSVRGGVDDETQGAAKKAKKELVESISASAASVAEARVLVGLSTTQARYVAGSSLHSSAAATTSLPATLPHDVHWIARVPASAKSAAAHKYLGYFSRGLLVAEGDTWHMVRRMNVEAAFVIKDGSEVLVLERNLEKALEALPLSWKVRRFGN